MAELPACLRKVCSKYATMTRRDVDRRNRLASIRPPIVMPLAVVRTAGCHALALDNETSSPHSRILVCFEDFA